MLDYKAIEGTITYALQDLKTTLTNPKGETRPLTVSYDQIEAWGLTALRELRQSRGRHEYAQAAAETEAYAVCRALTLLRQLAGGAR